MPTPITNSISRALRDTRISNSEVTTLISEARRNLTPEVKAELQTLLQSHGDKFSTGGRRDLERFLGTTNVGPRPPPPPPSPRDLADPAVLTKHTTDTSWKPVQGGTLYVDGISADDVLQGSIGNCYLVAALSSLAHANPDIIKNAIKDNGDNTFTVRFFEGGRPVNVTVDGDQATSASGTGRYAKSRDSKELWVGLIEKAYAQWKGGYEAIGNGGLAGSVMTALTGRGTGWSSTTGNLDVLYTQVQRGAQTNKPMAAPTFGKDSGVDYTGTGVYAWHMYSVLGASEENGTKYIQLRNPWGRSEHGSDGKDDGIFKMKLEDFAKLYQGVNFGN
ncbi:MAG: hypothetical protein INH41_28750 [Myxococcaceae bacterium]|jgi:hypothetical protein|nr:hypothetical protein [Myxococcaceae bacterium]MCA3016392.1 hypothetical protein [Myxococcaceae bacterium]